MKAYEDVVANEDDREDDAQDADNAVGTVPMMYDADILAAM